MFSIVPWTLHYLCVYMLQVKIVTEWNLIFYIFESIVLCSATKIYLGLPLRKEMNILACATTHSDFILKGKMSRSRTKMKENVFSNTNYLQSRFLMSRLINTPSRNGWVCFPSSSWHFGKCWPGRLGKRKSWLSLASGVPFSPIFLE